MKKKLIREKVLEKRKEISVDTRKTYSKEIMNKLINSKYYGDAKTIMTFISFSDEVDTHNFIKHAIEDGKKIVVPVTYPKTHELKPSQVKDFNELEPGYYNILAPKKEFERFKDPKEIDLVVVPGVAFRKDGYRIGYGGGYYDRFLSTIPDTPTIAIAFTSQIVENLPIEDFDIPVDYIYTEKDVITCKSYR